MTDVQIQDIKSFIQQRAPHDSIVKSAEPVIEYMNGYLLENAMQIPQFIEAVRNDGLIKHSIPNTTLLDQIKDIYEYNMRNNTIQFRVLQIIDVCLVPHEQLNARLRRLGCIDEICIICKVLGSSMSHPIPIRFIPHAVNMYLFDNQHLIQSNLHHLTQLLYSIDDKNSCRLNINDLDHIFDNLGTYLKRQVIQSLPYKDYVKFRQKLPEIIQQDNFIYIMTLNSIAYIKDLLSINNAKMKAFSEQLQSFMATNHINVTVHNNELEHSYNKIQSSLQRVAKELLTLQKELAQGSRTMQYLYQ